MYLNIVHDFPQRIRTLAQCLYTGLQLLNLRKIISRQKYGNLSIQKVVTEQNIKFQEKKMQCVALRNVKFELQIISLELPEQTSDFQENVKFGPHFIKELTLNYRIQLYENCCPAESAQSKLYTPSQAS